MAFNIDNYVKIKPWLQFVGYMLIAGGLIAIALNIPHPVSFSVKLSFGVAFLGLGVSMAGFDYTKIYP